MQALVSSWLLSARRMLLFARSSLLLEVLAAPVFLAKHALADKDPAVDGRDSEVNERDERHSRAHVRASGLQSSSNFNSQPQQNNDQ